MSELGIYSASILDRAGTFSRRRLISAAQNSDVRLAADKREPADSEKRLKASSAVCKAASLRSGEIFEESTFLLSNLAARINVKHAE